MASNDFARRFLGDEFKENYPSLIANRKRFQKAGLELIAKRTKNQEMAQEILDAVMTEGQRYEIDPLFILAQIERESRFNTFALGAAGERGLLQIKPSIALHIACEIGWRCDLNPLDLNIPAVNIRLSLAYLLSLKKKASAYEQAFIDAYNMGPTRLNQQIREGRSAPSSYAQTIQKITVAFYSEIQNWGAPEIPYRLTPTALVAAE